MAVLFVGLSFERVSSKPSATRRPAATSVAGGSPPPSTDSRLGLATSTVFAAGGPVKEVCGGGVAANGGGDGVQDGIVGCHDSTAPIVPVGGEKTTGAGGPAALSLELLQGSFSLLQSIVASHGGVIKELSVDDKGTVRGHKKKANCRQYSGALAILNCEATSLV